MYCYNCKFFENKCTCHNDCEDKRVLDSVYNQALDDYYDNFYEMLYELQCKYENDPLNNPRPSAINCLALMIKLYDELKVGGFEE